MGARVCDGERRDEKMAVNSQFVSWVNHIIQQGWYFMFEYSCIRKSIVDILDINLGEK